MKFGKLSVGFFVLLLSFTFAFALPQQARGGLEKAVESSKGEARRALERVQDRINERARERINGLSNVSVEQKRECKGLDCTNKTMVRGRGRARFLGFFEVERDYTFEVQQNGSLTRQQGMFDFLFQKEKQIEKN